MGTPVVVEAEVRYQRRRPARRVDEGVAIGPFAEQRLDEAFGLAVRAWCVGPREAMAQVPRPTDAGEAARLVGRAIVREQAPDGDATAAKPAQRVPEKRGTGPAAV